MVERFGKIDNISSQTHLCTSIHRIARLERDGACELVYYISAPPIRAAATWHQSAMPRLMRLGSY